MSGGNNIGIYVSHLCSAVNFSSCSIDAHGCWVVEWNCVCWCHLPSDWYHRTHKCSRDSEETMARAGVPKGGKSRSLGLKEPVRTYGILIGDIERRTMGVGESTARKNKSFFGFSREELNNPDR